MPAQESTTVRVSRRTHQTLTELAERRRISVTELLDRLTEQVRRREILGQYNAHMATLLSEPNERAAWASETAWSEQSAEE
jgi:hypothetical protein